MVFQSWNENPQHEPSMGQVENSVASTQTAPAGWYPTDVAGQLRYFDGANWTDHLHDSSSGDSTVVQEQAVVQPENQSVLNEFELKLSRTLPLNDLLASVTCKKIRDNSRGNAAKTVFGAVPGLLMLFPRELVFCDENGDILFRESLSNIEKIQSNPVAMKVHSDNVSAFAVDMNMKKLVGVAALGAAFGVLATSISAKSVNFNELIEIALDLDPSIKYKPIR